MKVKTLDGDKSNWVLDGDIISVEDTRPRSKFHISARAILYELFPTLPIIEEVSIHPYRNKTLYLDFYISTIKLVVEVHGQQHYKYNSLFHSSARDFLNQKKNDVDKKDWCEINGLTYIELPYNEDIEQWKNKIELR